MMIETNHEQFFQAVLFQIFGYDLPLKGYQFVSGGCINNAVKLDTAEGELFLKWNADTADDMFEKEAQGLQLMKESHTVNIPEILGLGEADGKKFLLLDYVAEYRRSATYWQDLSSSLAAMHKTTQDSFGLDHNNFIGRLPQRNTQEKGWVDFFIEHRLEVQLGLAIYNNLVDQDFAKRFRHLYPMLPGEMPEEPPALVHGDLWGGNVIVGYKGAPYLIDPAVHFGHREAELAFTRLFGGFDRSFYQSYHETYPLEPGFEDRVDLYNLYPLLVHVNLFGTSYLSGITQTLRRYL